MTEIEAKGFVQGKLYCMEKCDVFNKEDKHSNNECELCEYCYSQGNFGEQKEAFQMAIKALEKQEKIKEAFEMWKAETGGYYGADDCCEWEPHRNNYVTSCEEDFVPMMLGYKYCPYCGKKIKVVE